MKKLILAVLALSLGSFAFAKDWQTIRIATEGAFPPFNMVDKAGKVAGFEIDLFNEICKEMKVTCTWQTQDWDGIIPALLAKKYDIIVASMSITDERLKTLSFSKPYYRTPFAFIAKKGAFKDVKPETLKGKRIGVQSATVSENFVRGNYSGSEIKAYEKTDDAYLDLKAGRLDLVFNDSISTDEGFLQKTDGEGFAFVGPNFLDKKWFGDGIGAGIRMEDADLKKLVDAGIDKVIKSGFLKKLNSKYLKYSIVP